jgi:hypothetical protein
VCVRQIAGTRIRTHFTFETTFAGPRRFFLICIKPNAPRYSLIHVLPVGNQSMTDQPLGRLERVDLRDIWISEATSFTPWLARPENMAVLAETLNIDLELEAQERAVGPFRADLLWKDLDTDVGC